MLALLRAGIEVDKYDAYEIDEDAINVSHTNFPDINHLGNVFNAQYKKNEYDIVIGGSPCTTWSIAAVGREREREQSLWDWLGFI